MRFGLNFFPSFRLQDMSTAEYYALGLRLSERADELGYASIKTVEHYFHDYGGHSPNPIVLLSAIAARTRRIRLITGAVIPAFNNPIKLAGELAMLDNISNGRLDAGFGRAFIPKEFDVFGVSMEESRARFEEGIDIITRLWTEERVSYEGKFHRFRDVRLMPRPVQKPHPPIWIAAVATKESFIWAGRHGYHIMIVPFASNLDLVRDWCRATATPGERPATLPAPSRFNPPSTATSPRPIRRPSRGSNVRWSVTSKSSPRLCRRGRASNQTNTPAIVSWWTLSAPSPRRR